MVALAVFFLTSVFFLLPGALFAQAPGGQAPPAGGSSLAGWGIEYQMPKGWKVVQNVGRIQMLGSDTEAGAIFAAPGLYTSPNEAIADLTLFYQSMNMAGFPIEPPSETTIAGLRAVVATIVSQDQMMRPVHARFIGMLTPHGTGLNLLAMTTPDKLSVLRVTLEGLAATVKATAPIINRKAVAELQGTWMLYSGGYSGGSSATGSSSHSYEETVVFDGQGRFQYQSSSSFILNVPGSGGSYGGGAGSAGSDSDQGTYTVIGSTLVLKGTKGQFAVDIQFQGDRIMAGGKTYVRSR